MSGDPHKACFHCGEPIPPGVDIRAHLKNDQQPVCCEGCRAVAELIAGVGLEEYYRYRSEPAARPAEHSNAESWNAYDGAEFLEQYTRAEIDGRRSAVVLLDGMRCAACAWLIDKVVRREPGVCDVSVNAATARARFVWSETETSFSKLLRTLADLGYRPVPMSAEAARAAMQNERRAALKRLAVSGLGMMQVMMFAVALYIGDADMDGTLRQYFRIVSLLVATPVLLYAGWPFFSSAANALRQRSVNMDVPVSIALVLAYGASVWNTAVNRGQVYFDSVVMFIFFLTLARFIEMLARHRTGSVTEALARLLPRVAHRMRDGVLEDVAVHQLAIGDEVWVRVGETIPADGKILSGETACDEALLTGESARVKRRMGDAVIAGALNAEAPFVMTVTAVGQATVLSGIVALLDRAQTNKPRLARAADRAASWFLGRVLLGAAVAGAAWLWFDPSRAFDAVLAVLVVTCPCALSLATPVAIAAATLALARRGLLVVQADAIEALARIDRILFDKTGTLTQGQIAVERCRTLGSLGEARCFAIAAALEQAAEHPIAGAFKSKAEMTCVADDVRIVVGQGVEGRVDGETYRIGTPVFVGALFGSALPLEIPHDSADIVLGGRSGAVATFSLADTVRAEAGAVVAELEALGVHSEILSGDAPAAVKKVAAQTGIATYRARLAPGEKLERLQSLIATEQCVAVIGDGVNDAPILRAAPVSIAMSSGSALAQANADLLLMSPSLSAVPAAVMIARRAHRIGRQNLAWAAAYNLCALPLAAFGLVPPWLAAVGMSVSSIVVVTNALRLMPRAHSRSETRANYSRTQVAPVGA